MFKKIVVAIDGSDISLKALEVALSEARIWDAELDVDVGRREHNESICFP